MNYRSVAGVVFWALMLLTGIVLVLNLPDPLIISRYIGPLLLYTLLTAFALFFGVALLQGELSAVHAIGVLAALSLPEPAQPSMTWALAIGAALGSVLMLASGDRTPTGPRRERSARAVLLVVARVTLSFQVAVQTYHIIGGTLPINLDSSEQIVRLLTFSLVYTGFYFILYLLENYGRGYGLRYIVRVNAPEMLTVLLLPLPLAVLGAHIYNTLSLLAFAICMIALGLAIVAPHVISRTQKQLRKQVEELRSLSVMSQAIRANHEYRALMNMVYVQVSTLLDIRNFAFALYRRDEGQLVFPLVIKNGQQVETPPQPMVSNTPIGRVLDTQLPLLLARDAKKEAWVHGLDIQDGIYSWLGVPLQAGGSLFGALVVTSPSADRVFTADDLRLLNIVAGGASVSLENRLLYEQQTSRARRLGLLNSGLTQITESLSLDAVLDTILQVGAQLGQTHYVALMLASEDGRLRLSRARGLSDEFQAAIPQPLLVSAENGNAPIQVSNVRDDARTAAIRDVMLKENLIAWLELPMAVGQNRLAVLTLYYRQPRRMAEEDVELLRAFATQAAQAVQNASEYRRADDALSRRVGQLLALATISHELTATLDTRSICSLVLEFALNATYTHTGTVMLKDEYAELEVVAQYGYPLENVSRRELMRQRSTRSAFESGEPVLIADMAAQQEVRPLLPALRSQLAVPIVRRGETIGVITLESEQPNAFSQEDEQFVQQLSDQAVIAIDNTRLFQRITEARDRVQLILDNMSEPLVLIDRAGTIALANPRVDKLHLQSDVLLGQNVETLLAYPEFGFAERLGFEDAEDLRALVRGLGQPVSPERYTEHSYKLDDHGDTIYLRRKTLPVKSEDESAVGLLFVFYDETESHQLAQAREDFSRMIIHDLRSPLTAVTTSLKLMNDMIPKDSELKDMIETTSNTGRRAIKKLLNRVDSLLDVAKMESGQLTLQTRPTELATLIDSVCVELSPLAHELGVALLSDLPEHYPLLAIDGDKVERVLQNLLDNALKFSPEAGEVTVRSFMPGEKGAPPGYVRVEVIDQGPGIPVEMRESIFKRFVQVQNRTGRRRGTGLGLTFCRIVVESHQGRIWIEDNPDGGSIFVFTLPAVDAFQNGHSESQS